MRGGSADKFPHSRPLLARDFSSSAVYSRSPPSTAAPSEEGPESGKAPCFVTGFAGPTAALHRLESRWSLGIPKNDMRLRDSGAITPKLTGHTPQWKLSVEKPNTVTEANDVEKPSGECAPVHRLVMSRFLEVSKHNRIRGKYPIKPYCIRYAQAINATTTEQRSSIQPPSATKSPGVD